LTDLRTLPNVSSRPWPEYPKTVIQNGSIFVVFEDQSTILWGMEDSDQIKIIAAEIEDGLRAIQFLTDRISQTIKESSDMLECRGFSESQIKEYLNDSISSIISKKAQMRKNYLPFIEDNRMLFYIK
jgi:hypothetical protein